MSDLFKFEGAGQSGAQGNALSAGAERMASLARSLKDQQLERIQSGARRPESEAYVSSPEEAWSKKYMIQCVGPVCTVRPTDAGALLLPRFQPQPAVQAAVQNVEIAHVSAPDPAPAPAAPLVKAASRDEGGPIGLAIGKKVRKRSLLGRMFRR